MEGRCKYKLKHGECGEAAEIRVLRDLPSKKVRWRPNGRYHTGGVWLHPHEYRDYCVYHRKVVDGLTGPYYLVNKEGL